MRKRGYYNPVPALMLAALRKMFNWAEVRYGLTSNPCHRVEMPGSETARDRILTDDELAAVYRAAGKQGSHFESVIKLLILTGQRRSEVAGMGRTGAGIKRQLLELAFCWRLLPRNHDRRPRD